MEHLTIYRMQLFNLFLYQAVIDQCLPIFTKKKGPMTPEAECRTSWLLSKFLWVIGEHYRQAIWAQEAIG